MNKFHLNSYLSSKRKLINNALGAIIENNSKGTKIKSAMEYSLMSGGKRLRPILCIAAAETVGSHLEDTMGAACAIEMIHTYSLIHDDLPSMDDDDLRRGQPTLHRAFTEGTAVLAGDGLLTLAFEIVGADGRLTSQQVRRIIIQLAAGAGCRGMVGGQQADLDAEGKSVSPEELEYIHSHKTGALLTASVLCGAIAGEAEEEQLKRFREYGMAIGLAFQIKDDLLDVEGETAKLGKSTGQDEKSGKATYPAVWGIEASRKKLSQATIRALTSLEGFGEEAEPLRQIARFIASREK